MPDDLSRQPAEDEQLSHGEEPTAGEKQAADADLSRDEEPTAGEKQAADADLSRDEEPTAGEEQAAGEEPESDDITEKPEIIEEDEARAGLLEAVSSSESSYRRTSFEEFVDERILLSADVFGNKQMKIKVLEVSDEHPPVQWRFGDRVKITKILVTIKHVATQEVEEAEFDIEAIERELAEKRHYTSTNRWVPTGDIKNGYVVGARHTSLVSDAVALDYIMF